MKVLVRWAAALTPLDGMLTILCNWQTIAKTRLLCCSLGRGCSSDVIMFSPHQACTVTLNFNPAAGAWASIRGRLLRRSDPSNLSHWLPIQRQCYEPRCALSEYQITCRRDWRNEVKLIADYSDSIHVTANSFKLFTINDWFPSEALVLA